ncbi:MAG: thiamine phosphate synthase [Oxalobacteraceae bacterium]
MKGLYLVTPDWDDTDRLIAITEQALGAGAAIVQYRHKTASESLRSEQASALLALCRRHVAPFIINDHLSLCEQLDADGLHVGGTDRPVADMRAALGVGKIIGASCYGDLQLARDSAKAGASYVAFGGFYPSRVKKYEVTTPADIVSRAKRELSLPVCVIGGMTPENSRPLVEEGADMVAAISSVYQSDAPAEATSAFAQLFTKR